MRWPFHHNTTPSPDTGVGAGVGGGESGAGSAEVRAGWRELPPLQRSTEDLVPIAPAASFRESLAAHQDPRFLAPLGHSLVVDAPAGEVSGYATPVSEVAQRVSFPHPPSADISSTAAGSAPVGLQRAVDGGSSSSVPRAFSLPAATTFAASELPAVEPRPVPATPVPATPAPVTSVPPSSLPVVQTSPDPVASTSVPTVPSVPAAPPAPSAPVVSRSVESHDHSHHDHSQHEQTEHDHTQHEHVADEQTLAGQGGEVVGAPVHEMPLVGLSEPLGQSPFVSALGGPEPGSSVQRAAEAEPVVKQAPGAELVVHRVAEVGPVVQRAVEVQREVPEASVNVNSKPVAHRWLQPEFAVQRAAESGGVVSGGLVSGGNVAGGNVADGNLSCGSGDWAAASAPAMPAPVVPDSVADAAAAQRAVDGVLPVHQVQRTVGGEPVAPAAQRSSVDEPSRGTRSEVGLVGQREMAVQRAVEAESVGREAAADGHPARIAGIGPVVQRVGEGTGGVQQAAEGTEAQRAVEGATVIAGPSEQGRAEAVQRSIVPGGAAAAHGAESERAVQRAVEVGPVVARTVAGPAELLWPPPGGVDEGETAPLSSAVPLTVPEVQRPVSVPVGSTPPAVQRVVYGHPGLSSPARPPRATPQAPSVQTAPAAQAAPAAQVPASVGQGSADGEVLSWSLRDSFHAEEPVEPAVQRAEVVRSVSLQQMFSGHAMTAPAEADHAVQRDEAPQEAPTVQTAEPAPAPAAAPVPAPAAGPAAGGAKTVSAAEVEELAKRLYEPLTAKLRAELWLDRERAGRVTDRW